VELHEVAQVLDEDDLAIRLVDAVGRASVELYRRGADGHGGGSPDLPLVARRAHAGLDPSVVDNQAAPFAPETPIFPSPRLICSLQDGAELARTLGDRMAVLMQGHGITTVGEGVEQATALAVYLERTAYMQWIASSVGKPALMPQKDIDVMKDNMKYRSYDAFNYFASLLEKRK